MESKKSRAKEVRKSRVAQKVLQFQLPPKLVAMLPTLAFSGRCVWVFSIWTAAVLPSELSLFVRLERNCCHSRNWVWQRSQDLCQLPSGWNKACSLSRTRFLECGSQKIPPHFRQWWRRLKKPKGAWQHDAEHTAVELSG
jgi:hypothetical protein